MELQFFRRIFEKYSFTKIHENPSSRSQVVQCGRKDRWTDTAKLTVAFRNFANEPKTLQSAHNLHISVFYGSENKQRFLPCTVLNGFFITEKTNLYFAVRTEYLNEIQVNLSMYNQERP